MLGYQLIGLPMGGEVPFVVDGNVFTDFTEIDNLIRELLENYNIDKEKNVISEEFIQEAISNGEFWLSEVWYETHTVKIILPSESTDLTNKH